MKSWMMPKNLTLIQEAEESNEKDVTLDEHNPNDYFANAHIIKKQTSFDPLSDIWLSPPDGVKDYLSRATSKFKGGAMSDFSRITLPKDKEQALSNFCDDMKLEDMLGSQERMGEDPAFDMLDMGMLDEEDRQFMLVDKDTGKVYDLRNKNHISKLEERNFARLTTDIGESSRPVSLNIAGSLQQQAWTDWWREKRRNN